MHTDIILPNELFSNNNKTKEGDKGDGILDIFDRYNFTVKEDEPLEKEVAVDPEMLGKVFENLLEVKDRKSKGTYYTPREVVHYMCQQSLINYLLAQLEGKVPRGDIETLIYHGESVSENEARVISAGKETQTYYHRIPESIRANAELIDDKLANIKVCDPAIGSGAFPVGMMGEIVRARNALSNYIKDDSRTIYNFKRDCIHNSLYGVDIDPGAVEVAKLRLWLSLVVDEEDIKQIKPLPNLDYKIMQGNSLLEEYDGVRLFDEKIIAAADFDKEKMVEALKTKQAELSAEYISLHQSSNLSHVRRVEIDEDLKRIALELKKINRAETPKEENVDLFHRHDDARRAAEALKKLHKEFFETTQKTKKDQLKGRIEKMEWQLIEATLRENDRTSELIKLKEVKNANIKPYFLWKLHFSEVFQEKGGFDVIIANPPYITTKYGKISKALKEAYSDNYESAYDKIDLYVLFIEKGIKISRLGGYITFITPWNFLANFYSFKIRKFILDNVKIKLFNKLPPGVFESAIVDNIISIFEKDTNNRGNQILFDDMFDKSNQKHILQDVYQCADKYVFNLPGDAVSDSIFEKMKSESIELGKISLNYIGIMTGGQKKMIADKPVFKNSKPVLSGKDIDRWVYFDRGNFVNFDRSKIHSNDNEKIYLAPRKILLRKTGLELTACLDEKQYFTIQSLYNMVLKSSDYKEEYLLALLNSRLYTYIYNKFFITNPKVFPYIKRRHLDLFPIKKLSIARQKPFIAIVSKILAITNTKSYLNDAKKKEEVRDYERQIDQMVYELHGLAKDEIKIIEGLEG